MKNKPKIILFDIENSPITSYTWSLWETNVVGVKKDWQLLSFAWKELGKKKVTCVSRPQFKDKTDKAITKALWNLMNDSDILVAHNAKKFDVRKAQAKFLEHGFPPPSPFQVIDTLQVAKKYFSLSSNKLNDLGKILRVGQKEQTGGFKLWEDCMHGLRAAWRTMIRYNKQDVLLLEAVYLKLLPWITSHPRVSNRPECCTNCGSEKLQARGTVMTKTGSYQRFVCKTCGRWLRSRIANKTDKAKYVNL